MLHSAKEGETLWEDGGVEIRVVKADGGEVTVAIKPLPIRSPIPLPTVEIIESQSADLPYQPKE